MSSNDSAGRIHRQAFVASSLVLLGLALIAVTSRCYIRFIIQRQIGWDDAFAIFGTCCLITAFGILPKFIDEMYLAEALAFPVPDMDLPSDFMEEAFDYQKWSAVFLILLWIVINSVKFSFLFFFRKLIDRVHHLQIYWWAVLAFVTGVFGYGTAVYIISCPYFYSFEALQCESGSGKGRVVTNAVIQMVLDITGDLLILAIPFRLIWKVRLPWTRKAVLVCSLCLTVLLIVMTIIRVSGLQNQGKLDVIWEDYWLMVSAELGLILTAIASFRAFFVSRNYDAGVRLSPGSGSHWYHKGYRSLRRGFARLSRSRTKNVDSDDSSEIKYEVDLPTLPRATMTGMGTFINGRGRTVLSASRIMGSHIREEEREDPWPLTHNQQIGKPVTVWNDLAKRSEETADNEFAASEQV